MNSYTRTLNNIPVKVRLLFDSLFKPIDLYNAEVKLFYTYITYLRAK